jgi:hypothetical protein
VPPRGEFELPEVEDGSAMRWQWAEGSRWRVDGVPDDAVMSGGDKEGEWDYDGAGGKNGWVYYDNKVCSLLPQRLFPVTNPPTVAERPQRARRLGPVDTASEMVPRRRARRSRRHSRRRRPPPYRQRRRSLPRRRIQNPHPPPPTRPHPHPPQTPPRPHTHPTRPPRPPHPPQNSPGRPTPHRPP